MEPEGSMYWELRSNTGNEITFERVSFHPTILISHAFIMVFKR